jgi:hypothetical protein
MGGNDLTRQRNWEGFVVNTRKKLAEAALQECGRGCAQ